jgi:outer membrane murein-binding lipoprotein Lpp
VWQPPPIKRSTLLKAVVTGLTVLAGLTGGSSYLGNATADVETRARIDRLEDAVDELKLDVRDMKRELRRGAP